MKKSLLTILAAAFICNMRAQVVYTSSFESWTSGSPDGWMGAATNISASKVTQVSGGSTYGNNAVQLTADTSHKRFSTSALSITSGTAYVVKFWVKGNASVRSALYHGGSSGNGNAYQYGSYITINSNAYTQYSQTFIADSTSSGAEFLLSVKSTPAGGLILADSFAVETTTLTTPNVYQIQYSTATNGDSPLNNQTISTGGIVSAVDSYTTTASSYYGFWIQNGSGPWTGVYVFDGNTGTHATNLSVGDSVTFSALVTEFNGLTELKNISNYVKVGSGYSVNTNTISTSQAGLEDYEGVLVKAINANCTASNGVGNQWTINDGSGDRFVDDELYSYSASAGSYYNVTGIAHWSYSERKIEPRNAADIQLATGINQSNSAASVKIYPNPSSGSVTVSNLSASDVVNVFDLSGKLVVSEKASGGNLELHIKAAGVYFLRVTSKEKTHTEKLIINN
jgi:hypothetical protein